MARTRNQAREPTRRSERIKKAQAAEKPKEDDTAKIVKRKSFRRPRQRKSCRLLALPGELRNRIYRYALVEHHITVTRTGPGQPDLLKACRAIRREGRGIYYAENNFTLQVHKYDGAAFVPFARQYIRYPNAAGKIFFQLTGAPNWDNLVAWIKAHHSSPCMIPDMDDPEVSDDFIVGGALRIADAMHWMFWGAKEKALQGFYHGMKGTCSRWVRAEDKMAH